MKELHEVINTIETKKTRSAWDRGVNAYALEMLEELAFNFAHGYITADDLCNGKLIRKALLNGAKDWQQYSWGGCSLIYNSDIAGRLCCPSELRKTRNGERRPNSREEWLDVQARALFQACNRICKAFNSVRNQ